MMDRMNPEDFEALSCLVIEGFAILYRSICAQMGLPDSDNTKLNNMRNMLWEQYKKIDEGERPGMPNWI